MNGRTRTLVMLLGALACGCSKTEEKSSSATTEQEATPAPPATAWQVSERGAGPIRIGMTVAQAESALGAPFAPAPSGECATVRLPQGPDGMSLMVVEGRIARIDAVDSTIVTAAGARVGDTEARVQALYPGRVTVSPHKYTDGHYLIVGPASPDGDPYRIIFETDGTRVTRWRSGRLPEVEWVEGCS